MTQEERERAQLLESLLRFNLMKDSNDSKDELVDEIARLISLEPVQLDGSGIPKDSEDLNVLIDRLAEYHGRGSWFDVLDEEEKDSMLDHFKKESDEDYINPDKAEF